MRLSSSRFVAHRLLSHRAAAPRRGISGRATIEGTQRYQQRFNKIPFTNVSPESRLKLATSRLGFGSYRVEAGKQQHERALGIALTSGFNVIDTSTNYTDGLSEQLVGEVMSELIQEKDISRDVWLRLVVVVAKQELTRLQEVVVVSKVGYIQGTNMEIASIREGQGKPYSEVVKVAPDIWHCISPDFIEDQVTRSLQRLQLETLDVMLLHNPEYYWKTPNQQHSAEEFYERVGKAFVALEKEVERGRIGSFGISSNTFPLANDPHHVSFSRVLSLTTSPHFTTIQYPFNLLEGSAFIADDSLMDQAKAAGLWQLGNRPLNAFTKRKLTRLISFPSHKDKDLPRLMKEAFDYCVVLEKNYPGVDDRGAPPKKDLYWGHILLQNRERIPDLHFWNDILEHQIKPAYISALERLSGNRAYLQWVSKYRQAIKTLLTRYTWLMEHNTYESLLQLEEKLATSCPSLDPKQPLSRRALQLLLSTPIDCVLLGMRRDDYVQDALAAVDLPRVPHDELRKTFLAFK